jgi:DNA-binding winged helix-turn-helix (wHTH) protein
VESSVERAQIIFVFGAFEADERRFELRRDGLVVPLQRRTLEVIFFFLKNRGRLITKRALIQGPGGGVSVGDSAMYRAVMLARRALEGSRKQSFIVTVRGAGYRFDGEVRELSAFTMRDAEPPVDTPPVREPVARPLAEQLIGRTQERLRLSRHLEAARGGRGLTVVLSGPAGVGKTALVEVFAAEAQACGARVARGRSWEGQGAPALLPWAEVVRALVAPGADYSGKEWPAGFSELLAQLVPELAPPRWSTDLTPPGREQTAHERLWLFGALARFLVMQSRPGPLLLVLEDLHAADEASLLMLQFLRGSMRDAPLLVVVTLREGEGADRASIRELLASGPEAAIHLVLGGLPMSDVKSLLERLQGYAPSAATVETVCRFTEGNPLWIGELARAGWIEARAQRHAVLPEQSLPVPERAQGWMTERMRRLPEAAKHMVRAAAVIGREFSWPFLVEMLGLDLSQSLCVLRDALDSAIIEASPERAGEFRFSHALVRDAVYCNVPADLCYELHARAVTALEASQGQDESRRTASLAHHAAAAIPLLGPRPAIEHGLAAAHYARRLCSYELSAWHGRRVLGFLELASADDVSLRFRAWLALAESESLAGHGAAAMESFEAMMSASLASGQPEAFARAALSCFEHAREIAVASPLFHGRVNQALSLCLGASALRARLLAVHALLSFFYAPARVRMQQAEEAIGLARELNDPGALLSALRHAHLAALAPAALGRAQVRADEIASLAETFRDPIARLEAHFWSAQHALDSGNGPRFRAEGNAHAQLAALIRHPVHLWYAGLLDSVRALLDGELLDSIEKARAASALGKAAAGPVSADSYMGGQLLALAWLHEGRQRSALFAEVLTLGQCVLALAPGFSAWRLATLVARFEIAGGPSVAGEYRSAAAAFDEIPEDAYFLLCAVLLGHLAIEFRDSALLVSLERRLSSFSEQHVGVTSLYLGPVSFHLGRVAESLGNIESARASYQRAAVQAMACQAVPWQRAAQAALARVSPRLRAVQ